VFKLIQLLTL